MILIIMLKKIKNIKLSKYNNNKNLKITSKKNNFFFFLKKKIK